MTGLCGACTCDMEDLSFPGNRGILRACSTLVSVGEGSDEMVVDLHRMLGRSGAAKPDPMARFEKLDDPNDGFKARWNLPSGPASRRDCGACGARGVDAKGGMPDDCSLAPGCPFARK
uniref:Uncharacterized protein n=2 Tax=Cryptomonas curvata TaxID=233186 RepID=A0A7S0MDJ6_9CRYP|mmetsp:Transcript_36265/g.75819  ORF Transcript_36265/g.75819 Transcript_36265/m.75819 type:complete len:118 (+) Transcript_36265:393-746(+)